MCSSDLLRLGGEALPVLGGELGRVRIEPLLERDDLVLDEATHLGAQGAQLLRERETGEDRHARG